MLVGAVLGYLLGAIPSGIIVGRLVGRVDLRAHGSRRTGTTNALRVLGPAAAALVLVLDVAKGAAAVLIGRQLLADASAVELTGAVAGAAAIVGHSWSIFIGFGGGRGVATAAGALAMLSPMTVVILLPVVALVIWLTRYVSLASLTAAALAPIITAGLALAGWVSPPAVGLAVAAGIVITVRHADNIARLRAGTERRIGQREPTAPS